MILIKSRNDIHTTKLQFTCIRAYACIFELFESATYRIGNEDFNSSREMRDVLMNFVTKSFIKRQAMHVRRFGFELSSNFQKEELYFGTEFARLV